MADFSILAKWVEAMARAGGSRGRGPVRTLPREASRRAFFGKVRPQDKQAIADELATRLGGSASPGMDPEYHAAMKQQNRNLFGTETRSEQERQRELLDVLYNLYGPFQR